LSSLAALGDWRRDGLSKKLQLLRGLPDLGREPQFRPNFAVLHPPLG
jgi:hypothetical protein